MQKVVPMENLHKMIDQKQKLQAKIYKTRKL